MSAAHAIAFGDGEVFIAGGVESMTRAPLVMAKPSAAFPRGEQTMYDTTLGWRFTNPRLADAYYPYSMGETAENVVERCGVSREDQDAFALTSQQRWKAAHDAGRFADEVVAIDTPGGTVDTDEHPRPDATLESLATLKPAFKRDASGSVTAGNSSGINDGAAALLVMSEARARERGLRPMARMVASAVAGVDPATMGLGPIPATRAGARASRPLGRRPRPGRAQRGLRRPGRAGHAGARTATRRRSTSMAARSRSAIRSAPPARA